MRTDKSPAGPVIYALRCPCGLELSGDSEDDLVATAEAHLAERHPRLVGVYDREDMLVLSYRRATGPGKAADR